MTDKTFYYKHKIMKLVASGGLVNSVDVSELRLPDHDISRPLKALQELIEDGHLKWEWGGAKKWLVRTEEEL